MVMVIKRLVYGEKACCRCQHQFHRRMGLELVDDADAGLKQDKIRRLPRTENKVCVLHNAPTTNCLCTPQCADNQLSAYPMMLEQIQKCVAYNFSADFTSHRKPTVWVLHNAPTTTISVQTLLCTQNTAHSRRKQLMRASFHTDLQGARADSKT